MMAILTSLLAMILVLILEYSMEEQEASRLLLWIACPAQAGVA